MGVLDCSWARPCASRPNTAPATCPAPRQVASLLAREGIAAPGGGIVMIAHDTRPSGPHLAEAAAAGVRCLGVEPQMCGLLTTPQVGWVGGWVGGGGRGGGARGGGPGGWVPAGPGRARACRAIGQLGCRAATGGGLAGGRLQSCLPATT